MTLYIVRGDANKKWQICSGTFHLDSKKGFIFFFDKETDQIGLNDGNFHNLKELRGDVTEIYIDQYAIFIHCFLNINNKWHKDGFMFHFNKPNPDTL